MFFRLERMLPEDLSSRGGEIPGAHWAMDCLRPLNPREEEPEADEEWSRDGGWRKERD